MSDDHPSTAITEIMIPQMSLSLATHFVFLTLDNQHHQQLPVIHIYNQTDHTHHRLTALRVQPYHDARTAELGLFFIFLEREPVPNVFVFESGHWIGESSRAVFLLDPRPIWKLNGSVRRRSHSV